MNAVRLVLELLTKVESKLTQTRLPSHVDKETIASFYYHIESAKEAIIKMMWEAQ